MSRRSFKELSKTMTESELNSFCKRIAESYANSELRFARKYYAEHENISYSCFYSVLERAVVFYLVSEKTVNRMENKALLNQATHAQGAGTTTKDKYDMLRKKRNEYIIFLYSDERIKQLVVDFADHPEMSKEECSKKYDISISVLDTLIKKAIVENIVDDGTFAKIEVRILKEDSSLRTKDFFQSLHEKRNDKKQP
jgi:hypothetical protein